MKTLPSVSKALLVFLLAIGCFAVQHVSAQSPDLTTAIVWNAVTNRIAVGTQNGEVKVFDTTGQLLQTIQANGAWINSLAWSPNGQKLAVGDDTENNTASGSITVR